VQQLIRPNAEARKDNEEEKVTIEADKNEEAITTSEDEPYFPEEFKGEA